MQIAEKIKEFRALNKLTLKELSERTGLSISFLSDIEHKRRIPRLENLKKIADAFNIEVSDLLDEDEPFTLKENSSDYTADELEIEFERMRPRIRELPQEEKDKLIRMINAYLEK